MFKTLTIASVVLSTGCANVVDNVENFTCSFVPNYVADCLDPEVQDKVVSIATTGVVAAQITCQGIALGNGGKLVSVYYQASKLQDGSCHASTTVAAPSSTPGVGFVQASGANLTALIDPRVDVCPATAFHVPMLKATTTVENGAVKVESQFCTSGGNTFCTMPVSGCTGFNIDQF